MERADTESTGPERAAERMRATLGEIQARAREGAAALAAWAQIESLQRKESSAAKPYYEVRLRDGGHAMTLRAWSDSPAFEACAALTCGAAVEVTGEFFWNGAFGLDARRWSLRELDAGERADFFDGGESAREASARRMDELRGLLETVGDPRLRALCAAFLEEHGARFARAAAARQNHHARRGGLLEHTLQMLRTADALCGVYPALNRDLLLAGVLFHDAGKLWETCPPAEGFEIPRGVRGELLGHISIGIEVVNALWRGLPLADWAALEPASEDVRLHLLHLIASHHGELEYGSPVEPKTPEAVALHHIDNIDARMEMFAAAYAGTPEIAPGIHERLRPLGASPVRPLAKIPANE